MIFLTPWCSHTQEWKSLPHLFLMLPCSQHREFSIFSLCSVMGDKNKKGAKLISAIQNTTENCCGWWHGKLSGHCSFELVWLDLVGMSCWKYLFLSYKYVFINVQVGFFNCNFWQDSNAAVLTQSAVTVQWPFRGQWPLGYLLICTLSGLMDSPSLNNTGLL